MSDLFEVQIKESRRDGSPMAYIMGMAAFPDKHYQIPTGLQIGDFWKVEITGTNPRQTVHFFKFIKKVTETMRVCVFEGRWGTMWVWDRFSPIPKVIIPSLYESPRSVEVEDGVWLAEVSGYNHNTPTAVFLKKLLTAEEMLREQEKIERSNNGGYLPHEIEEAWERANHQAGPGYRDLKSPEEIMQVKQQDISDLAEFFFLYIKEMQTRHLISPVVTPREATSAYKDGYEYTFWHYIEKKKVSSYGSYIGYATNVAATKTATTKDVENFLISKGKDPEKFLIKEGYCDQDDGNTGHWRSE